MAAIVNWDTILVYPENKEIGYPLHVEYTSLSPNRESIILLHGYMGSIRDYEYIIEFLSDEYNIIAVDLRGHGSSELPKDDFQDQWTVSSLAEDIRKVINSLLPEQSKVNIVASSLSTAIALELTNRCPDLVDKLFLISPTQVLDIPKWGHLLLNIEKMTPRTITKFLISLTTRLVPAMKLNTVERNQSKELAERVRNVKLKSHQKILRETVKSWKIDISSINHPVIILAGEDDQVVPFKDSLALNNNLLNSSIVVMTNTGHSILYHHPEIVLMILHHWLKSSNKLLNTDHYNVQNHKSEYSLPSLVVA
ncbi:MAG: Tropinesterase [Candidatus Heimdallarchaeota archaeon LC_2]|nr:MAG: Tropinesterase [Candidatus Heimdallarchaeota archaeon LC_2]